MWIMVDSDPTTTILRSVPTTIGQQSPTESRKIEPDDDDGVGTGTGGCSMSEKAV